MPDFTVNDGGGAVAYEVEPFTVEYERQDNQEQRFSGVVSSVITGSRVVVRRIPGLRNSELTESEATALKDRLLAGEVDIAGDALGETITVLAEDVTVEPYGADEVLWVVIWNAIEV